VNVVVVGGVVLGVVMVTVVGLGLVFMVAKQQVQSRVKAAAAMKQHIIKGLDG
jgi:hypothetical protein